jgi:hypothetical protein
MMRRQGKTKLVYDKQRRTIVTVRRRWYEPFFTRAFWLGVIDGFTLRGIWR